MEDTANKRRKPLTPRQRFVQAAGNHLRYTRGEVTREVIIATVQPGTYVDSLARKAGYDLNRANGKLIDDVLRWASRNRD